MKKSHAKLDQVIYLLVEACFGLDKGHYVQEAGQVEHVSSGLRVV